MPSLMYLEASPRGEASVSSQTAQSFLATLGKDVRVEHLDLFGRDLPEFDAITSAAKYATMAGQTLDGAQAIAWQQITELVEGFKAPEYYLFSLPMWNFGIPYKLKQYIDLITHPGLTFSMGPKGLQGLVGGQAILVYTRGGNYASKDGVPDPFDFQSTYLKAWLGLIGVNVAEEVALENTLSDPDGLKVSLESARQQLDQAAGRLFV